MHDKFVDTGRRKRYAPCSKWLTCLRSAPSLSCPVYERGDQNKNALLICGNIFTICVLRYSFCGIRVCASFALSASVPLGGDAMSAPNPQAQPRYYTICAFSRVFHYWNLRISSRARIGSRSRGRFNSARKSGAHLLAAEIRERKRHGDDIAGYKSFHASSSSAEVQSGPQVL